MKKYVVFVALILIVCAGLHSDLLTAYKKGSIKLVPDTAFGAKTPWDMYFNGAKDTSLAFLPDGSFLRTSAKDSKVYRFNSSGDKVAEFGGNGQGPGDLYMPVSVEILDGKLLFVNDSGNRRICVFNLTGKSIDIIKPEYVVSSVVPLKDGKILVITQDKQSDFFNKFYRVLIRDLKTGAEKEVAAFKDTKPRSPIFIKNEYFDGTVHIDRVGNDKFLVAYSKSPEVALYTLDGEKISSFNVDIAQEKITFDHLDFLMKPDPKNVKEMEGYQKVIVSNKDKIQLPEFHQYYLGLTIDPENHILLFLNNYPRMSHEIAFQAYSQDGKLLATVKVDPGDHKVLNPSSLAFHGKYVFVSLEKKDAEGSQIFARVKIAD
jgi:WD40 repeat protein